jgi:hypothetical protein
MRAILVDTGNIERRAFSKKNPEHWDFSIF